VFIILGDIAEQHRRPFLAHYDKGQYQSLIELARQVPSVVGEGDVIIAQQDRALSYFSRRRCMPALTARRWPATDAEWQAYRARLEAATTLYVVLPGPYVEELMQRLPLEVEQQPLMTAGRWSLHRARLAQPAEKR
jgi:hypothetical protein